MPDPGENIWSWSTTAANNATADSSINWAEGMPRADVNNGARSMMAAHAKDRNLRNGSIVTAGTVNAQTFSSGLTYTSTPTGFLAKLKIGPALTNTGAATLSMDGITAAAILGNDGLALNGGELPAGSYQDFRWDGTNWILLGVSARRSAFSARATQGQVIGPTTYTQLNYQTEVYDLGGDYDTANSVWTPPAGKVAISAAIYAEGTLALGSFTVLAIYKSGVLFRKVTTCNLGNLATSSISIQDDTNGSQIYSVHVYIVSTGTTTTSFDASNSWFMGAMIE